MFLALILEPSVTVQHEAPLALPGFSFVAVFVLIASVVFVLWRRRKGFRGVRRSHAGTAMGNGLLDLNAIFQPHHANAAVVCRIEEEELRDDAGEGPRPWTRPPTAKPDPYRGDDQDAMN